MYRFPAIAKLDGFRKLTTRETQVILLSSEGSTDVEVARQLKLTPESISRVWTRIKGKLGLGSRVPAVALVSSAIGRLNERLSFEPLMYTGVPLVLGGFFDVAMLVNRKGTVLSCSIGMSRIFGAWPGLSWSDLAIGRVGLTCTDPTAITFEELLGPLDLADPVDARRMRVYVRSADKTRPFDLVIRGETDQILGRVIFVEFRAVSENGASQAPHAVLN